MVVLGDGEPEAGPWRVAPLTELVALITATPVPSGRPRIVAVDGRGGGGKSSLADRLAAAVPVSAVVHTDDIAWHHSRFDWTGAIVEGVLEPLRAGHAVHYQPPGWGPKGRTGFVDVPAGLDLVVIEGVGASRRALTAMIDGSIWVQSDFAEAERRGLIRDGGSAHLQIWNDWMAEELPFLARDRPWERAQVIVGTTGQLPHDEQAEVVLAPGALGTELGIERQA